MESGKKANEQLFEQLAWMRRRIAELEEAENDRKREEEALRESERKSRSLVEATSDWVWEVDEEGVYTDGIPKIRDLLGYELEEVLGRKLYDFMLPPEKDRMARIFHEAVQWKAPLHSIPNTKIHKNGRTVVLETSAVPMIDAEGRLVGYCGTDRDITKQKRPEASPLESEKRFTEFMEHLPVGVFIKDATGRLLFANRYLEEFFGWRDWVGRTAEDLVPHEIAEQMTADDRRVLTEGPMVFQEKITDIRGAEHYFDTYRFPMEIEGAPTLVAGIRVDITRRKLAETLTTQLYALKERLIGRGALNEKLKMITEAAVQIFDADFARVWILKEGDLCEKGCSHAKVTEDPHVCRDRSRCLHLVASSGRYTHLDGNHRRVPLGAYKIGNIASGRDASFLTNDVTRDSSIHNHEWAESLGLVSFAGFRLISPDADPIGVLALFKKQPITPEEMRFLEDLANTTSQVIRAGKAEEALRESENRFRSLVLNSSDTITVLTADGTITYQSPSLKRFFGYEPEDLVGRDAFPYVHPGDLTAARAAFSQILEHPGTSVSMEYRFRHADGSWIFVESVGSSFLDDPNIRGVVLNSRDISERKRAEEELQESEQRVRRLNEHILNLVMVLSHDIRGPLVAIASILKLLLRGAYGKLEQSPANTVKDVLSRCARLLGTAEDYLGKAAIVVEGSMKMEREVLDLREDIIDAVLDEIADDITRQDIVIDNRLGAIPAGSISISANKTWLKAVYRNLFTNAIKYGGKGCTISFGFESDDSHFRLNVYNTGKPIAEEDREKIFSKFGRVEQSQGPTPDGVGLGLSLCREIIRDHNGEIWYEPRPDGSNFVFTISREDDALKDTKTSGILPSLAPNH